MIERKNNYYNKLIDETLRLLIDFFGNHLLSVSSFSQTPDGLKPVLLVQIDEPLINLLYDKDISPDKKEIPAFLKGKTDFTIYIITAREMATFSENFPIELVHIKNRYRKLYGNNDPIAQMNVDFNNLHNAVKIALQGILMHLRTAYLSQNYDDLFVVEIINRIYSIFEAALFLRSQSIPVGLSELVFKVESCYNQQNSILSGIVKKIEDNDVKGIAENMLALLTTLEEILGEVKGIVME